jgi:hypothetical protein
VGRVVAGRVRRGRRGDTRRRARGLAVISARTVALGCADAARAAPDTSRRRDERVRWSASRSSRCPRRPHPASPLPDHVLAPLPRGAPTTTGATASVLPICVRTSVSAVVRLRWVPRRGILPVWRRSGFGLIRSSRHSIPRLWCSCDDG